MKVRNQQVEDGTFSKEEVVIKEFEDLSQRVETQR